MSKRDSKRFGAFAVLMTFAFAFDAAAQSELECDLSVTGQNNPAVDVAAVTSAVNPPLSGDVTVCLSGTFDFGTALPANSASVVINPGLAVGSLRIVGVNNANGQKATIRNGTQPLTLGVVATLPSLTIENLRFVSPAFSAISLLRANQTVRIIGNTVAGVRTFSGAQGVFRQGIAVTAGLAPINGEIFIEGNVINAGPYTSADTVIAVNAGIALVGAIVTTKLPFNARVTVRDNRLNDWSGSGIFAAAINDAAIENNHIDTGVFANQVGGCAQPNGVGAGSGIALANVTNSLIRDNVVNVVPSLTGTSAIPLCTAGIIATGIAAPAVQPPPGSPPAPAGANADNIFYSNRVRGSGNYALVVGATGFGSETDNVFALNGVANFVPTTATLLLGPAATDNVLIGSFPVVHGNTAANDVLLR